MTAATGAPSHRGPPDIGEIATFVRVVRKGTLAAAARDLGVPRSTVSRRIARLEERLAVKLMHRSSRRVVPTREGRGLYDRVASAVDTIEVAVHAALDGAASPRGSIRITAPVDFGRLWLLDQLQTFADACPEISLEVELTDRFVDLVQEGFDVAIRAGRSPSAAVAQELISRHLMTSIHRLFGNAVLAAQVKSVPDVERLPFVLFRQPAGAASFRLLSTGGTTYQLSVSGRFIVHDYSSMAKLVADGAGLGLLPDIHVHSSSGNRLVPVLPELSLSAGHIRIVYPSKQPPRRVSLLIEHLTRAAMTMQR